MDRIGRSGEGHPVMEFSLKRFLGQTSFLNQPGLHLLGLDTHPQLSPMGVFTAWIALRFNLLD
jgi:hypothetical protein